MRRVVSRAVLLHWAVFFGALAFSCVSDPSAGLGGPLRLLGLQSARQPFGDPVLASAMLGSLFLLCAALHLWALLASNLERADAGGPVRSAFASGVFLLTLLLAISALDGAPGFGAAMSWLLAATLASYLAIVVEAGSEPDPAQSAARLMAEDAAHTTSLGRRFGRTLDDRSEG